MSEPFVAGIVLAANGSRTVGRPTPLLPYGNATLLDHTLATARACEFDQLLVVGSGKVRERVALSRAPIVNSLARAIDALDPATTVLVLLRADQPDVVPGTVRILLAARGDAPVAACRYEDGRGHPYAVARERFPELRIGTSVEDLSDDIAEVPIPGPTPRDVDTWADYEAVVATAGQPLSSGVMVAPVSAAARRRGLRD